MGAGGGFRAFAWFDDLPARQASRDAAVQGNVRRRELWARFFAQRNARGCRESPGCWGQEASGCRFQEAPAAGAVVRQQGKVAQLVRVRPAQHRLARSPLLARHHLAHPGTDKAKESVLVSGLGDSLKKVPEGIDNRLPFVYI